MTDVAATACNLSIVGGWIEGGLFQMYLRQRKTERTVWTAQDECAYNFEAGHRSRW